MNPKEISGTLEQHARRLLQRHNAILPEGTHGADALTLLRKRRKKNQHLYPHLIYG